MGQNYAKIITWNNTFLISLHQPMMLPFKNSNAGKEIRLPVNSYLCIHENENTIRKTFGMEPIDKEIIEFADDFFFRLSELQLKERIEDFKERQISLYTIMHLPINLMKTGHQKDIFWRMMLLMDHCFNSYPVRLSRLSKEKVNVPMEDMERRALKLEKQGLKDMPLGVYLQEIGQVELTTLLINKVDYYVGKEALYDEYIGGAISYIILNASKAYQNELRRLFEQNG